MKTLDKSFYGLDQEVLDIIEKTAKEENKMEIFKDDDIIVRKAIYNPSPFNRYEVGFVSLMEISKNNVIVNYSFESALLTAISMQKEMFKSSKVYCEINIDNV